MSLFIVDVEADGPAPGLYSMVCFGAVKVEEVLKDTFYGETAPISGKWLPNALAVSGFSRETHAGFEYPGAVMQRFRDWVEKVNTQGRPTFVSDNPAFDWQFINYYFHEFVGSNPFGFSARRIGDFYAGLNKNWSDATSWKKLRRTKHTHNPVDDAKGNAEALLELFKRVKW